MNNLIGPDLNPLQMTTLLLILFLTFQFFSNAANADEITLFATKPISPIIWLNPSAFAGSLYFAQDNNTISPVGHMTVELKCDPINGDPPISIFDGMTAADGEQIFLKVEEGYGFGALFLDYPGKLHGTSTRLPLKKLLCEKPEQWPNEKSRVAFLKIKVSHLACLRMQEFYQEFKRRGFDQFYGGVATYPLNGGRGANCGVFAISFLEAAGLLSNEMKASWFQNYIVPNYLIGTPDDPKSISTIMLTGLIWGLSYEDGIPFSVPDPQLIYDWIQEKSIGSLNTSKTHIKRAHRCKYSDGIEIDLSHMAVPVGPLFP